jgi:hypothetical protein
VTGELRYLDDESVSKGEVYAAFVVSHVGNATLDKIDPTEAMVIVTTLMVVVMMMSTTQVV